MAILASSPYLAAAQRQAQLRGMPYSRKTVNDILASWYNSAGDTITADRQNALAAESVANAKAQSAASLAAEKETSAASLAQARAIADEQAKAASSASTNSLIGSGASTALGLGGTYLLTRGANSAADVGLNLNSLGTGSTTASYGGTGDALISNAASGNSGLYGADTATGLYNTAGQEGLTGLNGVASSNSADLVSTGINQGADAITTGTAAEGAASGAAATEGAAAGTSAAAEGSSATLGSVAGTLGTAVPIAAAAVLAAKYGMPVLGNMLGSQSKEEYASDPSSNFMTQAANITSYEWDRPVEAGMEALNIPVPGEDTLVGKLLNPGAAIVNGTWLCTEISSRHGIDKDDQQALSVLRRWAIKNEREDAELYFKQGYKLIDVINTLENADDVYLDLKDKLVGATCDLVRNEDLQAAFAKYKEVTAGLCKEYGVEIEGGENESL